MDAEVVIPWHDNGNRWRLEAYHYVFDRLYRGGFEGRVHPSGCQPWSVARARNLGVRNSTSAPVVVFNDADTVCPIEQVAAAVKLAAAGPGLVYAYDLYLRLDPAGTAAVLKGGDLYGARVERQLYGPPSVGCVAVSREFFEQVGGFDEQYLGTHYEDCDFASRCAALIPTRRVGGPAFHLWHSNRDEHDVPVDADLTQAAANRERWSTA